MSNEHKNRNAQFLSVLSDLAGSSPRYAAIWAEVNRSGLASQTSQSYIRMLASDRL